MESTHPAPELEKFLFYRGVGNFPAPLKVTMSEQGEISLLNTGDQPLNHLFVVAVEGERATVVPLEHLGTNKTISARLDGTATRERAGDAIQRLCRQVADALVAEGLYRAEAEAMVKTWRDAWFEDQGVRILYLLPRRWTDATLPITLTPQPRELVRVMVGRAELITPALENQVRNCIEDFGRCYPSIEQAAPVARFQAMKLGRFAPVAIRLAARHATDPNFDKLGSALLEAAAKSVPSGVAPAR
jgi:hypothetical protein